VPPGAPRYYGKDVVRYFWPDHKYGQPTQSCEHQNEQDLNAEIQELLRLRSELAAIKSELVLRRLLRATKANFNPNQPRIPAGNPQGGQWTNDGSGTGGNDPRVLSDAAPDNAWKPGAQYAQNEPPPEVPKQRPPTSEERNRIRQGTRQEANPDRQNLASGGVVV